MKLSLSKLLVFISLFLCPIQFSNLCFSAGPIGKTEFASIQIVSHKILETFPKDQYAYIGVGRSPVAIIAYLQTEKDSVAFNIPFSASTLDSGAKRLKLNSEQELRIFQHFEPLFPAPETLGGRSKLLLIDYAMSGAGLHLAQETIKKYIQFKKLPLQVKAIGITDPTSKKYIQQEYPDLENLISLEMEDHFFVKMATLSTESSEIVTFQQQASAASSPKFQF